MSKQTKEELMVFHSFAVKSGLAIDPNSIEKRPDGEPDILCEVTDEGTLAFEMTSLIDRERIAKRHSDQEELMNCIRIYPKLLLDSTQRHLKELFRNALVTFHFNAQKRLLSRKAAIKGIFDALLELDETFIGRVPLSRKLAEIATVEVVRVSSEIGPSYNVSAGGSYDPLPLGIIKEKFKKTYKSTAPMELLAYYGLNSPPVSQETINKAIVQLRSLTNEDLNHSQFRRIWLFDAGNIEVKFIDPAIVKQLVTLR
jgi:hypothetical protein